MKIGPYELASPFLLAPMAGITDAPFRHICRQFGAALTPSEMTTADVSLWESPKSSHRLDIDGDAEPRVVQIAGSEPEMMARAAAACVERGAQIIDINMGCPAKKVCRRLAGSALLQDEPLVERILTAVVNAVDVPVTLKTRTGWDPEHKNGVRVAQLAEAAGIRALAMHGRTRACRYRGDAEYATIAAVKQAVAIPVIANGDIDSPEKSLEVLRVTGVDGVMIGRAARGRPWIFRELEHFRRTGHKLPPLENEKVRDIMLGHLRELHRFYGEKSGVRIARKHIGWYCESLPGSGAFRSQVVRVDSASDQLRLTREFFSQLSGEGTLAA